MLPGKADVAAPDGPNNELNTGYLWDSALRAKLSVRNYGFFIDGTLYSTTTNAIPVLRNPFSTGTVVAYPRMSPSPRSPIHTSAASTTPFPIIGVSRSGCVTSIPTSAAPGPR